MSTITQCPECSTRFKASQSQLEAHQGMVRCGHCQATFDAIQNIYDGQPSPQLPLLMDIENVGSESKAEAMEALETSGQSSSPLTLTHQFSVLNTVDAAPPVIARPKLLWPWISGSILLLVLLLAQASYFFRVDIAAQLPGLKPALVKYCALLSCTIPLPKRAELISIESSDLEASPTQPNIVDLNIVLHNKAPFAQTYPNFQLTLTDTADRALAKRNFLPAEYLKPNENEKKGLSAAREISIKLHLDTTDLQPTGYRLFLYYPKKPG